MFATPEDKHTTRKGRTAATWGGKGKEMLEGGWAVDHATFQDPNNERLASKREDQKKMRRKRERFCGQSLEFGPGQRRAPFNQTSWDKGRDKTSGTRRCLLFCVSRVNDWGKEETL